MKKNLFIIAICCLTAAVVCSCSNKTGKTSATQPENTTTFRVPDKEQAEILDTLINLLIERKYKTFLKHTDMYESEMKWSAGVIEMTYETQANRRGGLKAVELTSEEMNATNDTAKIYATFFYNNNKEQKKYFVLYKKDDKWKANYGIGDIVEE